MRLRCIRTVSVGLLVPAVLLPRSADAWVDGNDSRIGNLGRFAGWPLTTTAVPYEQDLLFKISPDRIERSHAALMDSTWSIGFGWAATTDVLTLIRERGDQTPIADVTTTANTWISKRFAVQRRYQSGDPVAIQTLLGCPEQTVDATYLVTVSSVAPALWSSSTAGRFYIRYARDSGSYATLTGFSHLFYPTTGGTLASVVLSQPALDQLSDPQSNWDRTSPGRNWIVLAGEQNAQAIPQSNAVLPLMISFPPAEVDSLELVIAPLLQTEFFCLDFVSSGPLRNVALSMPYGARAFTGPASDWPSQAGGSAAVVARCNLVNGLACNLPLDAAEEFDESLVPGAVAIRDTFKTWEKLSGACSTVRYAPYPPVLLSPGLNDVSVGAGATSLAYPSKYGPTYLYVPGDSVCTYSIPAAPRHDIHVVRTQVQTEYQVIAEKMLQHTMWQAREHDVSAFVAMVNRGAPYALSLASQDTRDRYLTRMGETITQLLDDVLIGQTTPIPGSDEPDLGDIMPRHEAAAEGQGTEGWLNYTVPAACGGSIQYLSSLFRSGVPYDIDATSGTILEYIYEYLLWSGDTNLIQQLWAGTNGYIALSDIYAPLRLFHDWAWMGGTARHWGDGARSDMLNAQYAGQVAFARLAEVCDPTGEAASRARYLAAKAQIPLVARHMAIDHARAFYPTLPLNEGHQIIPGFGEAEPSGPLLDIAVRAIEQWSDWALAGERLHPVVFEAYERVFGDGAGGGAYGTVLSDYWNHKPQLFHLGMLRATFPEAKLYAFARNGRYGTDPALAAQGALADAKLYTQLRLDAADQGLNVVHSYEQFRSNPAAWYGGFWVREQPTSITTALAAAVYWPSPLYAGVLERFASPIAVGGWKGVGVSDVWVDAATQMLYANVRAHGRILLQCDQFNGTWTGTENFDSTWRTVEWEVDPGSNPNALSLQGSGVAFGTPVEAEPRASLFSYADFEGLGNGGSNLEGGWSGILWNEGGTPSHRGVAVRSVVGEPGNTRAMHLRLHAGGNPNPNEQGYLQQIAYLGEGTPGPEGDLYFKLTFRYRVPPGVLLRAILASESDSTCFDPCPPVTAGPDFQVNVKPVVAAEDSVCLLQAALEVESSTEWLSYEARGFYSNTSTTRPGPIRLQLNFGPTACAPTDAETEAWIDDVILTRVASAAALDFGGLRYPRQNQIIASDDLVPIQIYFDERVSASKPFVGMGADATLGSAQRWIAFEWLDAGTGTWNEITGAFPYLGNPNAYANNGAFPWSRQNWSYYGPTKLRVKYFRRVGETDTLVATIEGPWFVLAPPAPAMIAEVPDGPNGTQLDLTGTHPYGLLNFDYDADQQTDVLVAVPSMAGGGPPLTKVFHNITQQGAHRALFQEVAVDVFPPAAVPLSARTTAAGVIQDGDSLSVIVCTPADTTRVYTVDAGPPIRLTPLATHQLPDTLATGVWAAAFADMENDSDLDVYLVRAENFPYQPQPPTPPVQLGPGPTDIDGHGLPDALLEWTAGGWADRTSAKLPYSGAAETIAAAWADANGDGLQDVFVSHLGPLDPNASPGWSPYYINQGAGLPFLDAASSTAPNPFDIEISEPVEGLSGLGNPGQSPEFPRIGSATGAEWLDVEEDGDLDLVVSRRHSGGEAQYNLALLLNSGHGRLLDRVGNGLDWLNELQGVAVTHLDDNGVPDLIGVAATASQPKPPVFMGFDADTTAAAMEPVYLRVANSAGIGDGFGGAVISDDYDGDYDVDVLLARPSTEAGLKHYYYSNPANPLAPGMIRVRLRADGSGNNELGIGSTITVEYRRNAVMLKTSRLVDGGGRSQAQAGIGIPFGVHPDAGTTITVRAKWPDGFQQSLTDVTPGSVVQITDSHSPLLLDAGVEATYSPGEGWTVWSFEWDTEYSCSWHEVVLEKASGGSECNLPSGRTFMLTPETPDVQIVTTYGPSTGKFHHVLTWHRECVAPCAYRYTIRSYSATRMNAASQRILYVPICGQIQG